jgi:hypothetical protein
MRREMWREVVRLWDSMTRQGATTCWETFVGDDLDSLCHFWSSVPAYIMLAELLGVKPARPGFAEIAVTPQIGLVSSASGSVPTPKGAVSVSWERTGPGRVRLSVRSHADAPLTIRLPEGWRTAEKGPSGRVIAGQGEADIEAIAR